MGKLSMWGDKVVNHFWYCCQSCEGDLEMLKAGVYYLLVQTLLLNIPDSVGVRSSSCM